ncbi:TIGR03752 family integrating conjugative element protein [Rouxiella badensis]|uniref:TIGR03752 family integrating conjugative element protein n=1 Tax=Rouxiella badensis TaxID=1646377 RepID=UPI001D13C8BA|nr:TIGR03752 family integrating conjugative element protein [Rouxiella badensis]MCC3701666.1 TIGR03752 family integrating conjugative element protein [Rouxiella badensis]
MQIKSNGLVKIIVPVVIVVGLVIVMKSCNKTTEIANHSQSTKVLNDLTAEELEALGINRDTSADTLRTLVGTLRATRQQQDELQKKITDVIRQNEGLQKSAQNVNEKIGTVFAGFQVEVDKRQQTLQKEQQILLGKFDALTDQLHNASNLQAGGSDIPPGLGLEGLSLNDKNASNADSATLIWVDPSDQKEVDIRNLNYKTGQRFPRSFLDDNPITRQKAAYELQVKKNTNEKQALEDAEPAYTLPENSTLVGSRAMTALLGRVPINGIVTDPYPFKILIGKNNLTANGIELPDIEGAIVSGTASGDWTLSCVRGQVNSITFVFVDGTVLTLPKPPTKGGSTGNSGNKDISTTAGIGWISDDNGIPCISGERKSNAATYFPTIFAMSAAAAAGEGISQGQYSTQNNVNGISSTLTGSAGQAALGKALSGGMSETSDWVKQRYGMTFDAIYVPPGAHLAVHITRQLAIDYETKGRKVRHDFELPSQGIGALELD